MLSTLRVQVSSLSVFLESRLAEDPLVKCLLLAVERSCSLHTNVAPPQNLAVVLNNLTKSPLEPLSAVSIKWLTLKMAFLLPLFRPDEWGTFKSFQLQILFLCSLPDSYFETRSLISSKCGLFCP